MFDVMHSKRKELAFEGRERTVQRLKNLFLRTLHKWTKAQNPLSPTSFLNYLDMLGLFK